MFRVRKKTVHDVRLGPLIFPFDDKVMSPSIEADGVWEINEVNWLLAHVTKGSSCLNIGANVGYFTSLMSNLVGPSGKVWAFEPNRILLRFLKTNIKRTALKNVKIYPFAAGRSTDYRPLFLNNKNYGDSRMFDPRKTHGGGDYIEHGFDKVPKSKRVKMVDIDSLINERIDVVLIDTQGYDHEVLRGMTRLIENFKPVILTEFVPQWLIDQGEDPKQVLREYQAYGYMLGSSDFETSHDPEPSEILEKIEASNTYYTNVTLTPIL
jgi:FkbM family methyltransferase